MPGLHKLHQPLAQRLVALVHLTEPRLMRSQRHGQLVDGLRSARAHCDDGRRVVQRSYGHNVFLVLNLCLEEVHASGHLVDATNLSDV